VVGSAKDLKPESLIWFRRMRWRRRLRQAPADPRSLPAHPSQVIDL